jgi:hypothetical protein
MRHLAVQVIALALAACSSPPGRRSEVHAVGSAQARAPELQTVVQFLLGAAANDFHTHRSPGASRFRQLRIGRVVNPDGTGQYILCGQFLPAHGEGTADWTPFATIKTSGYEQWIGARAGSYCEESTVRWEDEVGDLSSSLRVALLRCDRAQARPSEGGGASAKNAQTADERGERGVHRTYGRPASYRDGIRRGRRPAMPRAYHWRYSREASRWMRRRRRRRSVQGR